MMRCLNQTPIEELTDAAGRPYSLWDSNLDLDRFASDCGPRTPRFVATT